MKIKFGVVLLVLLAVFAGWAGLSWFPSAKEAGYRSVVAWGESGSDPGSLDGPIGIALAGEEVFVSDSGNQRIEVFDRNGKFLRSVAKAMVRESWTGRCTSMLGTASSTWQSI